MIAITIEEEKIITDIIAEYAPDCEVYAYGSRVKGTNKKTSDLDLALALPCGGKLPLRRICDIKEAFGESDLVFRVDIHDYNDVERHFREIIDRERQIF